jgi:hypothetical protein
MQRRPCTQLSRGGCRLRRIGRGGKEKVEAMPSDAAYRRRALVVLGHHPIIDHKE